MKNIYLSIFLVIQVISLSQNLILNPSFENTNLPLNCNLSNFSQVNNWSQLGSADLYSLSCSSGTFQAALPNGWAGNVYPKHGKNIAGIAVYTSTFIGGREYFYQQLSQPLKKDYIYCMSYYVTRADNFYIAVSDIDAWFSNSPPTSFYSAGKIIADPQIKNYTGIITDTANWVFVADTFISKGNELFVTIGDFTSNINTNTLNILSLTPIGIDAAYYFFDSISLYICDSVIKPLLSNQPVIPNVFTPNYDGINDTFKIELKNATLNNFSIYDRWGLLMHSDDIKSQTTILWDGRTTAGEVCTAGVYFYTLQYTDANGDNQKKNGYITLIK